jgi:hypothetical protein
VWTVFSWSSGVLCEHSTEPLGSKKREKCWISEGLSSFKNGYVMKLVYGMEYEDVSRRFRTGRLERELQMVQFPASLVSFAIITPCVASRRVIPNVSVYFVMNSVRKLLDTHSYNNKFQVHICSVSKPRVLMAPCTVTGAPRSYLPSVQCGTTPLPGRNAVAGKGTRVPNREQPILRVTYTVSTTVFVFRQWNVIIKLYNIPLDCTRKAVVDVV